MKTVIYYFCIFLSSYFLCFCSKAAEHLNEQKQISENPAIYSADSVSFETFCAKADLITVYIPNSDSNFHEIEDSTNSTRAYFGLSHTIKIYKDRFICGIHDELINKFADICHAPIKADCDGTVPKITIYSTSGGGSISLYGNIEITTSDETIFSTFSYALTEDPVLAFEIS